METLVLVTEHRNHQYYSRSKSQLSNRFGCSPSKGFKDINCRSFHSEAGILPTPLKSCRSSSFTTNARCSSPKTPASINSKCKNNGKSNRVSINPEALDKFRSFNDDLSELWAGPAYCNSPPPSSLPIPKFSLRRNRSISLELPVLDSEITMHPIAKSAPPSPGREPMPSPSSFFLSTASATKDLRRILHLDIDENEF